MTSKIDIAGQRFGRLTVIGEAGRTTAGRTIWECICDCGNYTKIPGMFLRSGNTKSCGCLRKKHGHAPAIGPSSTYRIWVDMIARCENPNNRGYQKWYGGRGVQVHPAWRASFMAFLADMGERPPGLTLDRIDPRGNYEPDNCRWATWSEQRINQRRNK